MEPSREYLFRSLRTDDLEWKTDDYIFLEQMIAKSVTEPGAKGLKCSVATAPTAIIDSVAIVVPILIIASNENFLASRIAGVILRRILQVEVDIFYL
jgi:hypothetical protein